MKCICLIAGCCLFLIQLTSGQSIQRIDGSFTTKDTLTRQIEHLMKKANVTGMGISVFNNNKPVYSKTFGYLNAALKVPFKPTQVMYAASFSKVVFAYIVMQLVQEKVIDLDRPLVSYLKKPLPDYVIPGWKRGYQDIRIDKRY